MYYSFVVEVKTQQENERKMECGRMSKKMEEKLEDGDIFSRSGYQVPSGKQFV